MRLISMTAIVMVAFAANSVLNRLALAGDTATGPAAFAALRLIAGATILQVLLTLRSAGISATSPVSSAGATLSLATYVLGFSFAYVTLDTGVGALVLFGGVQLTTFAGGVLIGAPAPQARWSGSGLALAGLAWMLWPAGGGAPDPLGTVLMAAAAVGWGLYSLNGRGTTDPLAETGRAFLLAAPIGVAVWLVAQDGIDARGAMLAVTSGAITSGLGYALWYTVLPRLDPSVAALSQLTVPVIALAGGVVFLGEPATLRFAIASALVLGGVALGILAPQRTRGSSGS